MAEQESALDFIEATHLWSQHAQFVGRAEGAPNATAMSPVAGFTSTLVLTWNGNCNRSQIVWNRVITSHTPPGCASTP